MNKKPCGNIPTEAECDQQTEDDMNAIAYMLYASRKEGLECEVIHQLLQGNINNIPKACMHALYEWDIYNGQARNN